MDAKPINTWVARSRSTFFWQGILILLPVLILTVIGLYSLRRDRLWAEMKALEQAEQWVPTLNSLERHLNPFRSHHGGEFIVTNQFTDIPEKDMIWWFSESGVEEGQFCWVDKHGQLYYPPSYSPFPEPSPFNLDLLSSHQRKTWADLKGGNPMAYRLFLDSSPPAEFAATATYEWARQLEQAGQWREAARLLESLVTQWSNAFTEAGLPLQALALWQLAVHAEPDKKASCINRLARSLVHHPSFLTPYLLAQARSLIDTSEPPGRIEALRHLDQWCHLWELHESSRQLHQDIFEEKDSMVLLRLENPRRFVWWKGAAELVMIVNQISLQTNLFVVVAQTEAVLSNKVRRLLDPASPAAILKLSPYMAVHFSVNGDTLIGEDLAGAPVLAASSEYAQRDETEVPIRQFFEPIENNSAIYPYSTPYLAASIHLANRSLLYRDQRMRSLWFALIILAASGTAAWSWASARRNFQRERQLGELKTNFVSSVSHELRAPIASMRLLAEGLIQGRPEEKRTEYLRLIVQECARLGSLVENLLDFSRIEQGRKQYVMEPAQVAALIQETAAALQPVASERQVHLAVQIAEAVHRHSAAGLCLDARAIQQALINLLDNALKHSPSGSTVTLGADLLEQGVSLEAIRSTSQQPHPGAEALPSSESGNDSAGTSKVRRSFEMLKASARRTVLRNKFRAPPPKMVPSPPGDPILLGRSIVRLTLWVEDQGPGIPPEDHQRIFERFYRRGSELRRETQGAGIGLSIVRHVAEGHGGRVHVRSAPGQGSRFTLELPVKIAMEAGPDTNLQPLIPPDSHVTNPHH